MILTADVLLSIARNRTKVDKYYKTEQDDNMGLYSSFTTPHPTKSAGYIVYATGHINEEIFVSQYFKDADRNKINQQGRGAFHTWNVLAITSSPFSHELQMNMPLMTVLRVARGN